MKEKQEQRIYTPEDQRTCLMFGILMIVAKMTKEARNGCFTKSEEGVAEQLTKDCMLLVITSKQFFPRNDMEEQVIAFARDFARDMGFQIKQHYLSQGSKIPQ